MQSRKLRKPLYITTQKRRTSDVNQQRKNSLIKSGIYFGNFASFLSKDLIIQSPTSHMPTESSPRTQASPTYINKARVTTPSYQPLIISDHMLKLSSVINRIPKQRPQTAFISAKPQVDLADEINEITHSILNNPFRSKPSQQFTVLKSSKTIKDYDKSINSVEDMTVQPQKASIVIRRPLTGRASMAKRQTVRNQWNGSPFPSDPLIGIQQPKPTSVESVQKWKSSQGVTMERYTIGDVIGTGSYAVVRKAIDKVSGKQVAIKTYLRKDLTDMNKKNNLKREIQILSRLKHPNIMGLQLTVSNATSINLILEYISDVSLRQHLKIAKQLEEKIAKTVFRQLMQAVLYCHSLNIVHRDLKLENVMLDRGQIKLIDFGFSIKDHSSLNVYCGTPSYMAPEIVARQEYSGKPADIWAAGVLLYALLHGYFPFRGRDDKELFNTIRSGQFRMHSSLTVSAQNLISRMLQVNHLDRITAEEVLNDQWLEF